MSTNAFTPTGNTVVFTAANPAPTPIQVNTNGAGANQYRFINTGTITVFVGIANTSANAAANATSAFIGTGNTAPCIPLLPGTDEILTFLPNAYVTGNTASGIATVYVTPGDGL